MTRAQAYAKGFQEGRRWAEEDLNDHRDTSENVTQDARDANHMRTDGYTSQEYAAWNLGIARGYRDTVARFEAGTLTWEMFEMAPRSGA